MCKFPNEATDNSSFYFFPSVKHLEDAVTSHIKDTRPTFLNTMGSSSQTGFTAFPCDVFVLNAFLLVSTGKPNISTST